MLDPVLDPVLDRRTFLTGAAAAAVAVPLLEAAPAEARLRTHVLARGLEVPWGLAFLPDGDALVAERMSGQVFRVHHEGGRHLVGRIAGVNAFGEGGLLGVAVAPTFADDRWVYFYLTTSADNRVVRLRYEGGRLSGRDTVLSGIPFGSNHNGGRLAFGPDGRLYVSTGDAGHDLGRPLSESWAQDTSSLAGKILRLEPDGSIPSTNPFGNAVWSYGHRNVQGLAWSGEGRMWATELGQNTRDELNRIRKGHDYGWPAVEGGDGSGPYTDPLVVWRPTSSCSPSGLAIARGRAWVGALAGHALFSVVLRGPHRGRKVRHLHDRFGRIRTVEKAPDGSLWITTSNRDGRGRPGRTDDRVIRVRL